MRKLAIFGLIIAAILTIMPELEARGGRGGGGGGNGGRGGGGRSMSRSPSMSRSSPVRDYNRSRGGRDLRPVGPVDRGRPVNPGGPVGPSRPVGPGNPVNTARPSDRNRPVQTARPATPAAPSRPVGAGAARTGSVQVRPRQRQRPDRESVNQFLKNRSDYRPAERRNDSWVRRRAGDREISRRAQENIRRHYPSYNRWFNNDFWDLHHYHPVYYHRNIDWWRPATGLYLASWLGWSGTPSYVYYGDDGYYLDSSWYSGPSTSAEPETASQPITGDWLPLGVFALTNQESVNVKPKFIFQIALNKNGVVNGTYYNVATDETYPLEGAVDQDTQRIALRIKDNPESPILETGLYNLSQDQTPVRLTFADGRTQEMLLVRISNNQ